ncbi:MAG: regulatory protein RecX [Pseudomonadales bacterium]
MTFQSQRRLQSELDPEDATPVLQPERAHAAARTAALRALGRREYSEFELRSKLERNHDLNVVEAVLEELTQEHLLSDERFAEVFVRSRIGRGQGPLRIRQDLRQKGVEEELIDACLTFDADHWRELASQVLSKRSDLQRVMREQDPELRYRGQAKVGRFLASRGFPSDIIHQLLR